MGAVIVSCVLFVLQSRPAELVRSSPACAAGARQRGGMERTLGRTGGAGPCLYSPTAPGAINTVRGQGCSGRLSAGKRRWTSCYS